MNFKRSKAKKLVVLLMTSTVTLVIFQNCGKGFQSTLADSASLGLDTSPPPDPTGSENWVVGNIVFTEGNVGPYDLADTLPGSISKSPLGSFAIASGALPECLKDAQGRALSPGVAFDGKIYNHCPADTAITDISFSYEE